MNGINNSDSLINSNPNSNSIPKNTQNKSPLIKCKNKNIETLYGVLLQLENKYKGNDYMLSRLYNHIETLLPTTLESEQKIQQQREERKRNLSDKTTEFTERFLHTHHYYYCSHSELFIHYDGKHYNGYSEDDILHKIHLLITSEQSLMVWKHKITNNIMKQVREKTPLQSIPETETIQFVINSIYPSIFNTRNNAKYFLSIIGECIMNNGCETKKNLYITSPNIKILFDEIASQLDTYFGLPYPFHNVKYKYYDHDYSLCRLVPFPKNACSVPYNVTKYIFDFLCVATHYYSRFGSSDNFLSKCEDTELNEYSQLMCKNTPIKIVEMFIESKIKVCLSGTINTKNILFIWKKFLEERNVPNIILYGPLKKILKEKLEYDSEHDLYKNITSIHLPIVSHFIHFWDTYISEDDSELYIEVDEMIFLFRKTITGKQLKSNETKITDSLLIELIKHFYPDIEIVEDKYLLNIRCSLWDKMNEVKEALHLFRINENNNMNMNEAIFILDDDIPYKNCHSPCIKSLYDAYEFYCKINSNKECLLSKRYFEKMSNKLIGEYLDNDGVIINSFFTSSDVLFFK